MTKTKRIYVVDDDDDIRSLLKSYLEKNQYSVLTADSGEAFLEGFDPDLGIDLVILDIRLPGADGFSVCRSLRTLSNVPSLCSPLTQTKWTVLSGLKSVRMTTSLNHLTLASC